MTSSWTRLGVFVACSICVCVSPASAIVSPALSSAPADGTPSSRPTSSSNVGAATRHYSWDAFPALYVAAAPLGDLSDASLEKIVRWMWNLGETCRAQLRQTLRDAAAGVPTIVHTQWFPDDEGCSGGCRGVGPANQAVAFTETQFLGFAMAAFLATAGDGSLFGFSNMQDPNGGHEDLGGGWSGGWYEQYGAVKPGAPLGPGAFVGGAHPYRVTRAFANGAAMADCATGEYALNFKDGGDASDTDGATASAGDGGEAGAADGEEAPTPAPVILKLSGPERVMPGAAAPDDSGGRSRMGATAVGGTAGLCALMSLVLQYQRHHRRKRRRRRRRLKGRKWSPGLATVPEDGALTIEEDDEPPQDVAIEIVI